ncbi:hypothetical protein [Actinoplanes sp. KI2]|uniref:hypothetical protein n=1 Tax=Actinoplanes sp. KI2 TaxID=2983315 RepID=UPI00398345BD
MHPGEAHGLLGGNGAGKSTTIAGRSASPPLPFISTRTDRGPTVDADASDPGPRARRSPPARQPKRGLPARRVGCSAARIRYSG